jgi:hypothetical protein
VAGECRGEHADRDGASVGDWILLKMTMCVCEIAHDGCHNAAWMYGICTMHTLPKRARDMHSGRSGSGTGTNYKVGMQLYVGTPGKNMLTSRRPYPVSHSATFSNSRSAAPCATPHYPQVRIVFRRRTPIHRTSPGPGRGITTLSIETFQSNSVSPMVVWVMIRLSLAGPRG